MLDSLYNFISIVKYKIYTRVKFLFYSIFPNKEKSIVEDFHKLYYDANLAGKSWGSTKFLGTPIQKCPFDLFTYQEIIFDIKPDLIIEAGTAFGGCALYMATICDSINKGEIVTIDIKDFEGKPAHKRIKYLLGSSTSDEILDQIREFVKGKDKVLIILDSAHNKEHVLKELHLYSEMVSVGSYIIVEDSNVNGHPVFPEHGPGPMEAIEEFMKSTNNFEIDKSREQHFVTFNPNGYLKRTS
jgi:cephalosporin hydroxylase